ncbi:unnamed protein product [Chrysoparadoxa australica]
MGDSSLAQMTKIINYFLGRADTEPFRAPVDWQGLGLFDYPQIISHPMDLGTIRDKLEAGEYKFASQCAADIRLVWDNCKAYNLENSDFYVLANNLAKKFEEKYQRVSARDGADAVDSQPPKLEGKMRLSRLLYKINREQLGEVIMLLDQECPEAVARTMENELELNLDALPGESFHKVLKVATDMVQAEQGKKKKPKLN